MDPIEVLANPYKDNPIIRELTQRRKSLYVLANRPLVSNRASQTQKEKAQQDLKDIEQEIRDKIHELQIADLGIKNAKSQHEQDTAIGRENLEIQRQGLEVQQAMKTLQEQVANISDRSFKIAKWSFVLAFGVLVITGLSLYFSFRATIASERQADIAEKALNKDVSFNESLQKKDEAPAIESK